MKSNGGSGGNRPRQTTRGGPSPSKTGSYEKQRPVRGHVEGTTVLLNSYRVEYEPIALQIVRVTFSDKVEKLQNAEEKQLVKCSVLAKKLFKERNQYYFDGADLIVAPLDVRFVDEENVAMFHVEKTGVVLEKMEEERQEMAMSLAMRKDHAAVGKRLFGVKVGPYLKSPHLEWMRCFLTSKVINTIVVDVRQELVTIDKDVRVMDYLSERKVRNNDTKAIWNALEGLKLRVMLEGKKRDFSLREVTTSDKVKFDVHKNLKEKYGVDAKSNILLCARLPSKDKNGPCSLYYPLDVCFIKHSQKVNCEVFRDDVLKHNQMSPKDRFEKQLQAVDRFIKDGNLAKIGCHVLAKPLTMKAQLLPSPVLYGKGNKPIAKNEPVWRPGFQFIDAAVNTAWDLFIFRDSRDGGDPLEKFKEFLPVFQDAGIKLEQNGTLVKMTKDMKNWAPRKNTQYMAFILVENSDHYKEAKRFFDSRNIPSQCMQTHRRKFYSEGPNYAKMLALKVNMKLKGANWRLETTNRPLAPKPTHVFGFDVYHPPVGSQGNSVAALVGSTDQNFQKFHGEFRPVRSRKELATLTPDMFDRFQVSKDSRILLIRDGVGKQSLEHVKHHEIPVLRERFPNIPLAVLVMTKRHHHRMVTTKHENVEAGTYVQGDGTVLPKEVFLLNSHVGVLGTSHCCSYFVLENDKGTGWSNQDLAQICFDLAHMHPRATKAVSMPSPMFQAHLLAYRARYYTDDNQWNIIRPPGMWWE